MTCPYIELDYTLLEDVHLVYRMARLEVCVFHLLAGLLGLLESFPKRFLEAWGGVVCLEEEVATGPAVGSSLRLGQVGRHRGVDH